MKLSVSVPDELWQHFIGEKPSRVVQEALALLAETKPYKRRRLEMLKAEVARLEQEIEDDR